MRDFPIHYRMANMYVDVLCKTNSLCFIFKTLAKKVQFENQLLFWNVDYKKTPHIKLKQSKTKKNGLRACSLEDEAHSKP